MTKVSSRIESLSPEKRELLLSKLRALQKNTQPAPRITKRVEQSVLPLSFQQLQLWFLNQMQPESSFYNMPAAVRLEGNLDLSAVKYALNQIFKRHEVLRSFLVLHDGRPLQKVHDESGMEIKLYDLAGAPDSELNSKIQTFVSKEATRPFKLDQDVLIRCSIAKVSETLHIIVLNMHHIVADGWSIGIFINEFVFYYRKCVSGEDKFLPELPIQYADYAAWQVDWLKSEEKEKQLAYWKQQLKNSTALLDLPYDYSRSSVQDFRGRHLVFDVDKQVTAQLLNLAKSKGMTLYMVLLAALYTLFYRYTGQDDFNIGTAMANRERPEIRELIGYFMNTLVMRANLAGNPTFNELLVRVEKTVLEGFANQDLPFEQVVEELRPGRDGGYSPFFQVLFVLQNAPKGSIELPGVTLSMLETQIGAVKFDLTFTIEEVDQNLRVSLGYKTGLFRASTIERLKGHFLSLLEQILHNPELRLDEFKLTSDSEKKTLLFNWNQTDQDFDSQTCIHKMFEKNLPAFSDRTAVVYDGTSLSFSELDRRANQLAGFLRSRGVGLEQPVGLFMNRSAEMMIGLLAILKAGGAYVPFDVAQPIERIRFMARDAKVRIIITQLSLRDRLNALDAEIFSVDEKDVLNDFSEEELNIAPDPENLAYIIYTSGTTGKPKGIGVRHRGLANLYSALNSQIYDNYADTPLRISLNGPLAFDTSVKQWIQLANGHTLYIISDDTRLDGTKLVQFIRENKLNVFECTPSQLSLMVEAGLFQGEDHQPDIILVGGEAIDVNLWTKLCEQKRTNIYNVYGPTECTVDATLCKLNSGCATRDSKPTIGKPVANMKVYILDKFLHPLPAGMPGELCISGEGLARGYIGRPALTAGKFVPDPFSRQPGARLYRTGDRARFLSDGAIEFLGRVDRQVKIRGFRIEPEDIESALKEQKAIHDAAIVFQNDKLAAFIIPENGYDVDIALLRAELKALLPEYMIPSIFIKIEKMPLTPNGKVDAKALIIPDELQRSDINTYVAPRNDLEKILVELWQDILSLDQVGIYDDFFECGGDSLKAAYFINRLQQQLHEGLNVVLLFEKRHVAALAAFLLKNYPQQILKFVQSYYPDTEIEKDIQHGQESDSAPEAKNKEAYTDFFKADRNSELPLSFAQQRLWFLDQLEPGQANYNIPAAIRLQGSLDIERLKFSLQQLIERHESLRTIFKANDAGEAYQFILDSIELPFTLIDLQSRPFETRYATAIEMITQEAQKPFDLATGPLLRIKLIRIANQDHILMLNMHHTIADGWSIAIIVKELAVLYERSQAAISDLLPPLPFQYADFALWQREQLQGARLQRELDYWQNKFADAPTMLELPTDRPRKAVQTFRGKRIHFELSQKLTKQIRKLVQDTDSTNFMVLVAVLQVLFYRYSGQHSILIGTPIAGRSRSEVENMVGLFVNTLVLRGDFEAGMTFRQFFENLKVNTLQAFEHQELPFEKLVDSLNIERSLSHNPLFQVMFAYQLPIFQSLNSSDLSFSPVEFDTGIAKFDQTISMAEYNGRLAGEWEYNRDLFDDATIERMIQQFTLLLQAIAEHPDKKIAAYPLLQQNEIHHIVADFNNVPSVEYARHATLHQLFEEQAARTPDQVALVYKGQEMTYDQLNRRANQLAHFLTERGVGPEQFVGVSLHRSHDLIVAILGILKAGAAYVPLDTLYPLERLRYMVSDTGLQIILSRRAFASDLQDFADLLVFLDDQKEEIRSKPDWNPQIAMNNQSLCYVIYTSGSTGWPKGVLVQHNTVTNLVAAYIKQFGYTSGKRVLQYFSYSFDGSVGDFFPVLSSGAALYMLTDDEMLPDNGLTALIRERRITNLFAPPAILSVLPMHEFPDLKMLASGGDVCTPELAKKCCPGRTYYNAYGPTETTVCASWFKVNDLPADALNVPIGKPIPNFKIYILDEALNVCPINVAGEMYIGGVGVTRGYLNRPDLTAEKFIPDPFTDTPGARMYATGDLCHYLPDGNIEFLGRIDQQVKIRGFRIELGEVEASLLSHPHIKDAIVLAKGDDGKKQLVAYLVAQDRQDLPVSELRTFLKKRLPEYMLPGTFIFLDEMPVAATGKVDRKRLPEPEISRKILSNEFVSAEDDKQKTLVKIWQDLLNIEQVGIKDNFFELGGDSISSIQMIARARNQGLVFTPKDVFMNPTIESLAKAAGDSPTAFAEQGLVLGDAPLTPIQYDFFEHDIADRHHWNQSILLETEQPIARELLEKMTLMLLEHHDALRMRYRQSDAGWRQYIAEPDGVAPVVYITGCENDANKFETEVQRLQSFLNLQDGPLIRIGYFDMGDQADRILIAIHHLVIDGISWRILLEDFQAIYLQLRMQQAPVLPGKTSSFKYWAEKLVEYVQAKEHKNELDFWLDRAKDDFSPLHIDHPDGTNYESDAVFLEIELDRESTLAFLQDTAAAVHAKPNIILLTALANAFSEVNGDRSLYVQLEGHGREDIIEGVDLSRTVGWFTTLYPVNIDLREIDDPGDQLRYVDEIFRKIPNNGIGFGLFKYLSKADDVRQALKQIPKPQVSFNYLGRFEQPEFGASDFRVQPMENPHERSSRAIRPYLIDISASVRSDVLHIRCAFSCKKFDRKRMEALLAEYIQELKRIIQYASAIEADHVFESIDVATDEEIDDILNELEI